MNVYLRQGFSISSMMLSEGAKEPK